ncbi:MAG: hypothetical protein AAFU67_18970, partial [Bacteroidota bacterium]
SIYLTVAVAIIMSYAGGELVNHVFGLPKFWSILVITVIVTAYSSFGGVRATIQTDAFQFINFVIIIPLLAILLVLSPNFDWTAYQTFSNQQTQAAFDTQTAIGLGGLVIYWLVSTSGLDPGFFNRYLAARSPKAARNATVGAGLFISLWILLMVFIGDVGAFLHPEFPANDQVLFAIGNAHFPIWLNGLFIIAMIGVIMSTQDTLINTSSIIFSEDLMGTFFSAISDQQKLVYAKGFTVFVGLLAILIAGLLDSVLHAIISVVSYYIPMMIPVTLFSIFKQQHRWQAAIGSMLGGFVIYFVWEVGNIQIIPSLLAGLMGSTLAYLSVDFYLRRRRVSPST